MPMSPPSDDMAGHHCWVKQGQIGSYIKITIIGGGPHQAPEAGGRWPSAQATQKSLLNVSSPVFL